MITKLKLFFANVHIALFEGHIEWEICNRIFPHLENERDYGYPFDTDEQLVEQAARFDLQGQADHVEAHISKMPRSYGHAFRYIMRRDLHRLLAAGNIPTFQKRLRMYARFAPNRVFPETCDPRFVATHA